MPRFAEIENGKVKHIIDTDKTPNYDAAVVRSFGEMFVELKKSNADVAVGWEYDGKAFKAPETAHQLSVSEARDLKLMEISAAYDEFERAGSVTVSLGYPIQCGQAHILRLDGAIRFAEQSGMSDIYITDADDITHDDISIADAKQALLEVTAAMLKAHKTKQELRKMIIAAETEEEIRAIKWEM